MFKSKLSDLIEWHPGPEGSGPGMGRRNLVGGHRNGN